MKKIQVIIMYSNKNMWLIPAFLKLWEKYAGVEQYTLMFCGYASFDYKGPLDVRQYTIDNVQFPPGRWSDSFMRVLKNVAEPTFIFMLEDYMLVRQVDNLGVRNLYEYAADRPYVLKIDLTMDRLWSGGGTRYLWGGNTYGHCGHLDLIRSFVGTDYQMSLWGGIFNRDALKQFLLPGETAQQIELIGTHRVNNVGHDVLVLGTRQGPLKHINAIQAGKLNDHEFTGMPGLEEDDRNLVLNHMEEQAC